jgi:hypothetical protein
MSFVEDGGLTPPTDPPANFSSGSTSGDEPVNMSLKGSRKAVMRMVYLLHRTNIIAGSEWSRPTATGKPGEVISVATRMITTD